MFFLESPVCSIIICCFASTCLWPLIERLIHTVFVRACNRFPRCLVLLSGRQGNLDKVLGDMVGNGDNIRVVVGVFLIGFGNGLMLANDDPYKSSIYLLCLSYHGFWSYHYVALMHGRGFVYNFFAIVTLTIELAIIGICSLPLLLTPAAFIIVSFLYVLFVVTYAMQLDDVKAVNERTEYEMKLENLTESYIRLAVAMGFFLIGASILWPDFEKQYRRTADWLRVYEFVAFWTFTAARLLKQGVFYEFNVYIGLVASTSLLVTFFLYNQSAGYEMLIISFSFVTVSLGLGLIDRLLGLL